MKTTKEKWNLMVSKIRSIENLRRRIEEDEEIDIEEVEIVGQGLAGKINNNLVEVESFLREVIKESKL